MNDLHNRPPQPEQQKKPSMMVGLLMLFFKLFKSAGAIKVALAGASFAAYSYVFNWQFAVLLIGCLVFHEYGHMRAMQKMGIKTKGIYLIPFFGGAAVQEGWCKTRWEEVYIAMMGPFYGLIMTVGFYILYLVTGYDTLAAAAAFSALLNLFNLLPIFPMDGGRVLKGVAFSMGTRVGIVALVASIGFGIYLMFAFNLALLAILTLMGAFELMASFKERHLSTLAPLTAFGNLTAIAWYLGTAAGLVAIIWIVGTSGVVAAQIPTIILNS